MHPAHPLPALTAAPAAAGVRWHLRLLGDVVLRRPHGPPQHLPGRAATALLARLALAPDQAQPREVLIELLWPGVALDVGRNRLRQVLSTLKRLLDGPAEGGGAPVEVVTADRLALRLASRQLHCDAAAFEAATRAGHLAEAAALYRGELLPGFYDEWIHQERNRLAELAEALPRLPPPPPPQLPPQPPAATTPPRAGPAALNLPHYLTQLHGADAAGARLRADVQAHRLVTLLGPGGFGKTRLAVEVAHSLADGACWGPQRQAGGTAPQRFDLVAFVPLVACRGAEARPEALLAALLMALHQDDARGQAPLQQLDTLLAGRRTLLVLDNFEQLVDACAALVATLLARCPGLHLLVTSRRSLGLDGEHERLLQPLPVPADDPGASPDGDATSLNPAVALFVDRARAVRADFRLDARNRAAVVDLVRQLQGMPLAIELAASRVRSLAPADLLALLQQAAPGPAGATPALALLARSGPRAAGDARHASMLAVVQWSWGLLSPQAQHLLPRLSVFAGSFSAAAVQALSDLPAVSVALALDELVAQSMLRADWLADAPQLGPHDGPHVGWHGGPHDGPHDGRPTAPHHAPGPASPASPAAGTRYTLYELIREFAASQLPEVTAVTLRTRHRHWLTGWFAALPLSTPLQLVRPEVPNLAAALVAAESDGMPAQAANLVLAAQTALSAISLPHRSLAALARCADALADPVQRAVTQAALARHWLVAGQAADAQRLADLALAALPAADAALMLAPTDALSTTKPTLLLPAGIPRALVLTRVAHVRWRLLRDTAAQAWLDEALALTAGARLPALQASIATNLGAVWRARAPAQALAWQRQAIALWATAGDGHGVNVGRCNLALALLQQRAGCAEALALLGEALADTRRSGDALQQAQASNLRGEALTRLGRWADAASAYQACVATAWAAAEPWPLVYGLWNLPRTWAHGRQPEAAARLMGFAEQHTAAIGTLTAADRHDLRRVRRLCQRLAPAADVARWWADGARLPLAQAVRLALQGNTP